MASPPWSAAAWIWTLLALALGVALVAVAGRPSSSAGRMPQRPTAFQSVAVRSHDALRQQLEACGWLVRSVQTLFLTSDEVTAHEFENVYANLHPRERFPSLLALAYAQHEARADGDHFITTLVAPHAGNERIFGLDVSSQPTNLAAVLASRDSDEPALSAPFRLVQLAERGDGRRRRDPALADLQPRPATAHAGGTPRAHARLAGGVVPGQPVDRERVARGRPPVAAYRGRRRHRRRRRCRCSIRNPRGTRRATATHVFDRRLQLRRPGLAGGDPPASRRRRPASNGARRRCGPACWRAC